MDYITALLQPYKGISIGIDKILTAEVYTDKSKKTHGELDLHNINKSISKFQMLKFQSNLVKQSLGIKLKILTEIKSLIGRLNQNNVTQPPSGIHFILIFCFPSDFQVRL